MHSRVIGNYCTTATVALHREVDQNHSRSIFGLVKERYHLSFNIIMEITLLLKKSNRIHLSLKDIEVN